MSLSRRNAGCKKLRCRHFIDAVDWCISCSIKLTLSAERPNSAVGQIRAADATAYSGGMPMQLYAADSASWSCTSNPNEHVPEDLVARLTIIFDGHISTLKYPLSDAGGLFIIGWQISHPIRGCGCWGWYCWWICWRRSRLGCRSSPAQRPFISEADRTIWPHDQPMIYWPQSPYHWLKMI